MKKLILVIASLVVALTAWSQPQVALPDTLNSDDVSAFLAKNPQARVATAADANIVVKLHKEIFYNIRMSDNDSHSATTVLRQVGEFIKLFKDARVYAASYADRGTGNYQLNQMYAGRRAAQFREDLIRQYNVDPSRIITESHGDVVQPFEENDLNRCVIVYGYGYLSLNAAPAALTAQQIAETQRAQYQQERDLRYAAERERYAPSHNDTLVISHKDTLWVIQEPDTLREERSFRVNGDHGWYNWFITVSGGPAIFQGDHNIDAVWKDRIYPAFDLSIGKWIVPMIGLRAGVNLDVIHNYYNANPDYPNDLAAYYGEFVHGASPNEPYAERPWLYRMDYNAWNFHADILVNFSSLMWKPYNRRFWNLIGYAGVGCIATWDHGSPQWRNQDWFNYATSWNVGLLNSFRVSEHFDINLDLRLKKFNDDFNCFRQGRGMDGITNLMIGFTWHFTKRGF